MKSILCATLFVRWLEVRGSVSPDAYFWAHPGEASTAWRSALVGTWLHAILRLLDVAPPLGCSWTSHSLRSGGGVCGFRSRSGAARDHELGFVGHLGFAALVHRRPCSVGRSGGLVFWAPLAIVLTSSWLIPRLSSVMLWVLCVCVNMCVSAPSICLYSCVCHACVYRVCCSLAAREALAFQTGISVFFLLRHSLYCQ